MKIDSITTKHDDEIPLSDFVVLVGPNNTGKSQTLRDIREMMEKGKENSDTTIVTDLDYHALTYDELKTSVAINEHPNTSSRFLLNGIASDLNSRNSQNLNEHELDVIRENSDDVTTLSVVQERLLRFKTAFLDASSRLEIADPCETYDFHEEQPSKLLQQLHERPEARKKLREVFNEIFPKDIILDFSSVRTFVLRVSNDFGDLDEDIIAPTGNPEQDEEKGERLDEQGAGYQSLAGVVLSLLLADDRVVLLDEPEAFLHPAQARDFGIWLSGYVRTVPGQVIVSTHNSHFLSGVLSGEGEVSIHRLNRTGDNTKYNQISEDVLQKLATDPLLASLRVMDGVFHEGIIVCEGDSDQLIYRYVAEEILEDRSSVFIPTYGVQNTYRIAEVLKDGAIPRVVIADLDILKKPSRYRNVLQALSGNDQNQAMGECNKLNQEIDKGVMDWCDLKKNGITIADGKVEEQLELLIEKGEQHGLFIVPVGAVEQWLNLSGKASKNMDEALEKIDKDCPENLKEFVCNCQLFLNRQYAELVE